MMYPNGSKSLNSAGWIHLRLWSSSFDVPPITMEFTFSVKTANGQKVLQRQRTADFKGGRYHDIKQFMSTSDFVKRQSEFLDSGYLTLVCTLKKITSTGSSSECLYCKGTFNADIISSHEKKCRVKCPECSDVVLYQNWNDHECEMSRAEGIESLYQDFRNMLLDGINHDLILKIKEREFQAHRDVLRTRSPVFKSMLTHDMVEKNSGVINVPDCDPKAMEPFLSYIYSGKVESIDQSNMNGLYYIADKYEMKDLKEECSKFIKKSLSTTNFCDVIQLAINHSDSSLLDFVTEYFIKNMLDIVRTVEWQSFLKDNSTVANELIIKSCERKQ